jgi:PPM family protein phosphatase
VADGMGGHAAGEAASRITVESIQEFIAGTEEEHENTWPFGFNNRYSLEGNRLTTAVEKANEKVMRAVQNRPELKGMGTTVVAALFDQDRVTLVHVGDSRAYLYRGRELKRLTDDHSWVQEQVNAGILSEDEAKSHPLKNVVTRALGGAAHVAVDLIEVPINSGDRFLLCSDGLTGMVSDEEIVQHLGGTDTPDRTVRSLVELANDRGGIDNITAILVEVAKNAADRRPTDPVGVAGSSISTESTVTVTPVLAAEKTEKVAAVKADAMKKAVEMDDEETLPPPTAEPPAAKAEPTSKADTAEKADAAGSAEKAPGAAKKEGAAKDEAADVDTEAPTQEVVPLDALAANAPPKEGADAGSTAVTVPLPEPRGGKAPAAGAAPAAAPEEPAPAAAPEAHPPAAAGGESRSS